MRRGQLLVLVLSSCLCISLGAIQRKKVAARLPALTNTTPKGCGAIPVVVNGQGLGSGNAISYACQPGFRLEGTNVITCIDGRWTVAPRCVPQVCPPPINIPFASPATITSGGTQAFYQCLPGYRVVGGNGATSQTAFCSTNTQSWSSIPTCEPIPVQICGAPPAIANGVSSVSGNVATYTCNVGFIRNLNTPNQITCVGTQWVFSVLPACIADPNSTPQQVRCTRAPPAGGSTIFRPDVADVYDVGSKITYTCITGYRITGSNSNSVRTFVSSCQTDGTWTPVPTCEPVDCGIPPPGINTATVASSSIKYTGVYTYVCLAGFETSSLLTATCNADGTFSIPAPACTRKVCRFSSLPTITNGAPQNPLPTGIADIPVGTVVNYVCNSGYRTAPASPGSNYPLQTITCLENGTFSAFQSSCVLITPRSCAEYYRRDNLCASTNTATGILIDADGPGGNPAAIVDCNITPASGTTPSSVCTIVNPSQGLSSSTTGATCSSSSFGTLLGSTSPPVTTVPGTTLQVCTLVPVSYPLTDLSLASLITSSKTCEQKVTITCTAASNSFVIIRRNGESRGKASSGVGAGLAAGDFSPALSVADDACDCYATAAGCTVLGRSCTCSNTAGASGTDTITKSLSFLPSSSPPYVVEYGILRRTPFTTVDRDYRVNIGPINCCESC